MYKLLLIVLIGHVASKPTEKPRIVGGQDIDIKQVPYQVSLMNRGRHSCGGAIIDKNLIITAAHCVIGSSPRNLQIRVGSSTIQRGGEVYEVSDLVWNPDFSYSKMDSDVALLWLNRPLQYNERVAAVKLADAGEEIVNGELTLVTGWGNTREGGGVPETLQMVEVPKVSESVCRSAYAPLYSISPRMLCAGAPEGGKDACQGDSGGPLVHAGKLAGVVSWGLGCARPTYPGVYAKVSALREWIDNESLYLRMKHIFRSI